MEKLLVVRGPFFMCLQSGERAHVKGPPQFGGGAGVGGERGRWRGRIR